MNERYTRTAVVLHWLIAVLLLAQISFGAWMSDIPRGTPERALYFNLHKSSGLVLLALIVWRLVWRLRHAPPPWPATLPRWRQHAAQWSHRALYVLMIVTPLAGYIASNFTKYGVKFFNLVLLPPWGSENKAVYAFFNGLHGVAGWTLAVLAALHVAVGLQHALRRDGVFTRIT